MVVAESSQRSDLVSVHRGQGLQQIKDRLRLQIQLKCDSETGSVLVSNGTFDVVLCMDMRYISKVYHKFTEKSKV